MQTLITADITGSRIWTGTFSVRIGGKTVSDTAWTYCDVPLLKTRAADPEDVLVTAAAAQALDFSVVRELVAVFLDSDQKSIVQGAWCTGTDGEANYPAACGRFGGHVGHHFTMAH